MRVTENQIKKLIHQSNLIEGYDDEAMDAQGLLAWRYLLELDLKSLTHYDICKVQKMVVTTQDDLQPGWRGQYRTIPVWVGGREVLPWTLIQGAIDSWIDKVKVAELDTKELHIRFEGVHPFADGNGRTGRLLMWWMELKREIPLTVINFDERHEYYGWFQW